MEPKEGRLFDVQRLVALDMGLHGPTFILLEFGAAAPGVTALGLYTFFTTSMLFGGYIVTIGLNYVPVLIHAISLRRTYDRVIDMNRPDIGRLNRRYSTQQFLIFIPFFVVVLDVLQRSKRKG